MTDERGRIPDQNLTSKRIRDQRSLTGSRGDDEGAGKRDRGAMMRGQENLDPHINSHFQKNFLTSFDFLILFPR